MNYLVFAKGLMMKGVVARLVRNGVGAGLVAVIAMCSAQAAQAQYGGAAYGASVQYSNQRAVVSYQQHGGYGHRSTYSVNSGHGYRNYGGGNGYYGHSHHSHQSYRLPTTYYGQRNNYVPHYSGPSHYGCH